MRQRKITFSPGRTGSHAARSLGAAILRAAIYIGISYVILAPLINLISRAVMPMDDVYSPLVYIIPRAVTLEHFQTAMKYMDYVPSLLKTLPYCLGLTLLQLFVSAFTGYGFARYRLPFGRLLFGLVVLTIIIPSQALLVPMYMQFRYFDPLGLISAFAREPLNLINTQWPMALLTAFGMGLNAGLYIYIFRQFFRGMPASLEEAAWIDGTTPIGTFFRIMLPNTTPAIIIVTLFSLVWQYNDIFFSTLFTTSNPFISGKLSSLQSALGMLAFIRDANQIDSVMKTGVLLSILPLVLVYLLLQRFFMEGIERSGIVG